jgi:hypothetical protein
MANFLKTGKNILTGNWLGSEINTSKMYYLFFVVVLVVFLIYNRYRAEEILILNRKLQDEVDILHSKYTKIETKLIVLGTERKVAEDSTIINSGLKLPPKPPKQIIIEK